MRPRLDLSQLVTGITRGVCQQLPGVIVVARQEVLEVFAGPRQIRANQVSFELRKRLFERWAVRVCGCHDEPSLGNALSVDPTMQQARQTFEEVDVAPSCE